jgi:hypothetical protein
MAADDRPATHGCRVIVIDPAHPGNYLEQSVRAALANIAQEFGLPIDGPGALSLDMQTSAAALAQPDTADVGLIIVREDRMATAPGGELPRATAPTIQQAFELLNHYESTLDLHLLVTNAPIKGPDIVSLYLSSVAGLARGHDFAELLRRAIMRRLLSAVERQRKRILLGDCYTILDNFLEQNFGVPVHEWEVLLALAEVPRPRLFAPSGTPSQSAAASALLSWNKATGFTIDHNSLRRRIGAIAKRLQRDEYDEDIRLNRAERYELIDLPRDVRERGYPECLIPVRNRPQSDLARLLYQGFEGMRTIAEQQVAIKPELVTVSRRSRSNSVRES